MTLVDGITLTLLACFVLLGALRGLVRDLAGIAGIILGGYLAWRYGTAVGHWFLAQHLVRDHRWALFLGHVLTLLAVAAAASAVGELLSWLTHLTPLGWFDRLLGAGLGLVKGLLLVWVIVTGCILASPQARVPVGASVLTEGIRRKGLNLLGPHLRLGEPERKKDRGRPVDRRKGPLVRSVGSTGVARTQGLTMAYTLSGHVLDTWSAGPRIMPVWHRVCNGV
jgi:membrane protein required for colicin V production